MPNGVGGWGGVGMGWLVGGVRERLSAKLAVLKSALVSRIHAKVVQSDDSLRVSNVLAGSRSLFRSGIGLSKLP